MPTLTLTPAEIRLISAALEEAIDYWSITDADGVRDSPANQRRITKTRTLLTKLTQRNTP
jgi:hypothetical protein